MKRILVNLTDEELIKLEKLLKKKNYSSRSEAFRNAIELFAEAEKYPQLKKLIEKLRKRFVSEFRPTEKEIKQKIINYLRKYPGSTINEISSGIRIHRHTVRKYLSELNKRKIVHQKKIGTSKVSYISRISRRMKHD